MNASDVFSNILLKKAGQKNSRGSLVSADIETNIVSKGLALQATFKAILKDEVPEDQLVAIALEAASERVDNLLEDFLDEDFLDQTKYGRTRKHKGEKRKVKYPAQVFGLRHVKGHNISGLQLTRMLNSILYDYIQKNMGDGQNLNNITGRFAHSAHITEVSSIGKTLDTQAGNTSLFFSYMVRPYSVFETNDTFSNGGARSPNKLIKSSIRDAIMKGLKGWLNPSSIRLASGFKIIGE